jgi:nitrate/nitrite-specific signal transduction histidine kinase
LITNAALADHADAVVREAINNAAQHANATTLTVVNVTVLTAMPRAYVRTIVL